MKIEFVVWKIRPGRNISEREKKCYRGSKEDGKPSRSGIRDGFLDSWPLR